MPHARLATPRSATTPEPRREFVQSLQRGFDVIKAFGPGARALTIAEVAAITATTRAVARRYLLTLQALGCVVQVGTKFTLTPKVLDLGFAYLSTIDVADVAQPFMERVTERLNESCSLAVLDGDEIVYVARVQPKRLMSISLVVGSRLPAHATSMGKVLLAHLPPGMQATYFETAQLKRFTRNTITAKPELRHALAGVRDRGWAIADQEVEEGLRTIAVPVFDYTSSVAAAMNISGHATRVSIADLQRRYLPVLSEAARQASAALGRR